MTRQEIEQKMDELAREYHDTHDMKVKDEIERLLKEDIHVISQHLQGSMAG